VDGRDAGTVTARESIFKGHRTSVEIEARGRSELTARSRLEGLFPRTAAKTVKGRVFRLHVLRQAVARPDFAEIEIVVPKGWKATGKTTFLGDLTQDVVLDVRLERTIRGAVVQKVVTEPLRLARRLLDRVL
jgi:hypothetical protein